MPPRCPSRKASACNRIASLGWSVTVAFAASILAGCEPSAPLEAPASPVADQPAEIEVAPEAPPPPSASQLVAEREAEMNRALREKKAQAGPDVVLVEPTQSPIPIVPTRPMFQDDPESWDEPALQTPADETDEMAASDAPPPKRRQRGIEITSTHVERILDQMSLHLVRDLMPVQGLRIDHYYKGRLEYEIWEWRSEIDSEIDLVRIRFIDDRVADVRINPPPHTLAR